MIDHCGREIDYLRISITDRCNLRCIYCMPEAGVRTMAHEDVLSYEEIARVTRLMAALGIPAPSASPAASRWRAWVAWI